MLTVPQEIKDILHQDSGYKNIRIHFPNGERSDICNDLIVRGSVSFKESLCSQNTLKFGLCEASVFECETVGVGNIRGCQIEVSCEIECPPSVTGAEWKSDLQKYIYAIPYGIFAVDEAKRQADMNHRKITAYGGSSLAQNYEIVKLKESLQWSTAKTYSPKIYPTTVMNYNLSGFMRDAVYTSLTPSSGALVYMKYDNPSGSPTYPWYDEVSIRHKYITVNDYDSHSLYCVKGDIVNQTAEEILYECLKQTSIVSLGDTLEAFIKEHLKQDNVDTTKTVYMRDQAGRRMNTMNNYIYPYQLFVGSYMYIGVPYEMWFHSYRKLPFPPYTVEEEEGTVTFRDTSSIEFYNVDYSAYPQIAASFARVQTDSGNKYVLPLNGIDYYKLSQAMPELEGVFLNVSRTNALDLINIKRQFSLNPASTLYPGSSVYPEGVTGGKLLPNDYSSCWYDDEYTKPFGAITCKYKDTNNDENIFTYYLTGFDDQTDPSEYQVYDFSGNALIDMARFTEGQIQTICQTVAANIAGVSYMPVDFAGRGLPYVEAGDTFEILTKSNDSITTIVLNRTIKGEQVLEDNYKSV